MELVKLVLCSFFLFGTVYSSAIPMWEFLSKQEKMSYLYSMFANQVEDFCEKTTMNNCNQELLKYGLGKLKDMPEDHLDIMDPYQRGANNIIWDSMMEGHAMMKTARKPRPPTATTAKPNSYEDESFGDFAGAASAKIDNYRVPPPRGFVVRVPPPSDYVYTSGTPQYYQPQQQSQQGFPQLISNSDKPSRFVQNHQYYHNQPANQPIRRRYDEIPLTGPMVVRVYPDGRPVRESTDVPQDEDLRQYKMSKVKIPNYY